VTDLINWQKFKDEKLSGYTKDLSAHQLPLVCFLLLQILFRRAAR